MRCVMMLTAGIVATVTMGTAVAPAAHYPRKLAPPWPQLAQTTETPRDETGGGAPAEVTTAVLEQHDAVLGRQVRSIAGEDMGRVVNVVVDQSGQVRAAIIDFGGFLGVGNRKIAVDWNALHFALGRKGQAEALYVTADALANSNRMRINALALAARLPTVYGTRGMVEAGGFMSYGANYSDLFRRAGNYADKILRGAKPADLPVEQPTKFDLVVNLITAEALGLSVPPTLIARADEVIE